MNPLPIYFRESYSVYADESEDRAVYDIIKRLLRDNLVKDPVNFKTLTENELVGEEALIVLLGDRCESTGTDWTEIEFGDISITIFGSSPSAIMQDFSVLFQFSVKSIEYTFVSPMPNGGFLVINPRTKEFQTLLLADNRKFFTA